MYKIHELNNLGQYFCNYPVESLVTKYSEKINFIYLPLHYHRNILKLCNFPLPYVRSSLYSYLKRKKDPNKKNIVIIDGSTEACWETYYIDKSYDKSGLYNLEERLLEICNALDFIPIILSCNRRGFQKIKHVYQDGVMEWYFQNSITETKFEPKPLQKKYICLNRTIRDHRIKLVHFLWKNNLLPDGYVSYDVLEHKEKKNFHSHFNHLINCTDEEKQFYLTQKPIFVDDKNLVKGEEILLKENQVDSRMWQDSFFSIVSETAFFADNVFFPTEKTWKTIYNYHPFIMFGSANTIKGLRDIGFDVFDDIFDHSYDKELDHKVRFELVTQEILRIMKLSLSDMETIRNGLQSRLEKNKETLHHHRLKESCMTAIDLESIL